MYDDQRCGKYICSNLCNRQKPVLNTNMQVKPSKSCATNLKSTKSSNSISGKYGKGKNKKVAYWIFHEKRPFVVFRKFG